MSWDLRYSARRSKAKVMPAIETYDDLQKHLRLHHRGGRGNVAIPTDARFEFQRQTGNYFAQTPEHEELEQRLMTQQAFEIHEALHDSPSGVPPISTLRSENDWDTSNRIREQKSSHAHAESTNPNPVWNVAKWKQFRIKKNEAREVGVPKDEYGKLHRAGIPHEDIIDFAKNYPNESMAQYRKARRRETHEDVKNFINNGGDLRSFVTWAHYRGSHWKTDKETGEPIRLPNSIERYTDLQNKRKRKNELEA